MNTTKPADSSAAQEQNCRVRLIKTRQHINGALDAALHGHHETALEHIRAAGAQLDEVMPCAA